jgi:ribonuclease BN (tRNA processing enzyme)
MRVQVQRVSIPAWSTVGYGQGLDEADRQVTFVGDHRPMRDLGRALSNTTDPISVEVAPWQITEGS